MTHPFPWVDRLTWWQRAALALDEFCGALLWGGALDVTISTRAYLERDNWRWRWLYLALDYCFPQHCERARRHDEQRNAAMQHYLSTFPKTAGRR